MNRSYTVRVKQHYKKWIAKESVLTDVPIYSIFENTLYPFYKKSFTEPSIQRISFTGFETSSLILSAEFKKILGLEAVEKNTSITSIVDTVFKLYLNNH